MRFIAEGFFGIGLALFLGFIMAAAWGDYVLMYWSLVLCAATLFVAVLFSMLAEKRGQ